MSRNNITIIRRQMKLSMCLALFATIAMAGNVSNVRITQCSLTSEWRGTAKVAITSSVAEKRVREPLIVLYVLREGDSGRRYCWTYRWVSSRKYFDDYELREKRKTLHEKGLFEDMSKEMLEIDASRVRRYDAGGTLGVSIRVPERTRLLLYRFEVWSDGACVAEHNSWTGDATLKQLSLQSDWYIYEKYSSAIKYL